MHRCILNCLNAQICIIHHMGKKYCDICSFSYRKQSSEATVAFGCFVYTPTVRHETAVVTMVTTQFVSCQERNKTMAKVSKKKSWANKISRAISSSKETQHEKPEVSILTDVYNIGRVIPK